MLDRLRACRAILTTPSYWTSMKNCILKYLDPLPVTKAVDSQSFLFQKFKHSWSLLDIKLHGSLKNSEIPELPEVFCGICLATKETTFSFSSDYINSFTVVKLESTDV